MTVSKTAAVDSAKPSRAARKEPDEGAAESTALQMGELSELLGYSLKRAQLKIFEDFLRCVAPLQLTPAQFSVLLLLDRNPGRNQTEIANTLGILRPNFVAMLDGLALQWLHARCASDLAAEWNNALAALLPEHTFVVEPSATPISEADEEA